MFLKTLKKKKKKPFSFHNSPDSFPLKSFPTIYLRIRPLSFQEKCNFAFPGTRTLDIYTMFIRKSPQILKQELMALKPNELYTFDQIFQDSSNFSSNINFLLKKHPVSEIFQGANHAFFLYGPKKSGKTYTLLGNDKTGLFYAYLQSFCVLKNQRNNSVMFMKVYQFDNSGFKDLLIPGEIHAKPLKIGFKGKVIGVSRYLIEDFDEGVEFLNNALENQRKSVKGHLFLEIEIEQKGENVIQTSLLFAELECERVESLENMEKMLREMKNKKRQPKMLAFFRKFDEFNDFMYQLVKKGHFSLSFIGCLDNTLENIREKINTLEFLSEMKELPLDSKTSVEKDSFFLEKLFENKLIFIKKLISKDKKNDQNSWFFMKIQEFLKNLKYFVKNEAEFQKLCSKIKVKTFGFISNEEKEKENHRIIELLRNMNDNFVIIKALKGKIKQKFFLTYPQIEEILPKLSEIFQFLEQNLEGKELMNSEQIINSVFAEKTFFLPQIKSIENHSQLKILSSFEKPDTSKIFRIKRDSSLNFLVEKAKTRVTNDRKIVRLRNHQIIIKKIAGKGINNAKNDELEMGIILGGKKEKKKRSLSFPHFNNNSFIFKVD